MTIIHDLGGYQLTAAITPVSKPANHFSVRIFSTWGGARDPAGMQRRLDLTLTREGLIALRGAIDAALGRTAIDRASS